MPRKAAETYAGSRCVASSARARDVERAPGTACWTQRRSGVGLAQLRRPAAVQSRPASFAPGPGEDPYKVLDIPPEASEGDVKKAYRKLALRWHPDRNPDNQAQADKEFKRISRAYAVLSDPEQRTMYDRFGGMAPGQAGFDNAAAGRAPMTEEEAARIFKAMFGDKPIHEIIKEVEENARRQYSDMEAKEEQLRAHVHKLQEEALEFNERAQKELNLAKRIRFQQSAALAAQRVTQLEQELTLTRVLHANEKFQMKNALWKMRRLDPVARREDILRRSVAIGMAFGAYFLCSFSFVQTCLVYFATSFLSRLCLSVLKNAARPPSEMKENRGSSRH